MAATITSTGRWLARAIAMAFARVVSRRRRASSAIRRRRLPARSSRSARLGHLKGHSEALEDLAVEMLARGLSVRDIEDAFKDATGRLLLSRTAISELGERLWADYQDFVTRDLGEYDIVCLFIDGIAERLRPGQRREPVLAVWGFTSAGARVLLHLMAGSKEEAETVSAFFQDMRAGGPGRWPPSERISIKNTRPNPALPSSPRKAHTPTNYPAVLRLDRQFCVAELAPEYGLFVSNSERYVHTGSVLRSRLKVPNLVVKKYLWFQDV